MIENIRLQMYWQYLYLLDTDMHSVVCKQEKNVKKFNI